MTDSGLDPNATLAVHSAGKLPLHCVLTLKAGSTFLRNLFHVLEFGALYDDPEMVHNSPHQTMQDLSKSELQNSVAFFVFRNPVDRFFSLYFDKIISKPPRNFPWIAARLHKNWEFFEGPHITLEQHRKNCVALAKFLKFRFNMHKVQAVNPHWRPQISVVGPAIKFGLKPLLQENLSAQLLQIANGKIDGLALAIDLVGQRNRSERNISAGDILTPDLENMICELYPDDTALYKLLKSGWAMGQPPDLEFLAENNNGKT